MRHREISRISLNMKRSSMKILRRIVYSIVIVCFVVAPGLVLASNGQLPESEKAADQSPWKDIKTGAKPLVPNISEEHKDIVEVFNKYWKAVKERDFKTMYEMEATEEQNKSSFDLYEYKRRKGVDIIAVRPLEVTQINEKEVIVRASFGFKAGIIDTVRFLRDRWIKESTGWKHVPEEM